MKRHPFAPALLASLLLAATLPAADRPNVVLIYADDIGYGDLGCYGATKVKTPNCDKLAGAGLRFTDAHTVASVCTPSRYSLLSGEYAFRKKGTGIASGVDGLLLDLARTTLPSIMKGAGYATGIIGKWHLGLGTAPTNYNQPIKPGPREVGFDYAWIMPATGDRVPCVWVENDRVVNLDPTDPIKLDYSIKRGSPTSMVKGVPRIGGQQGGTSALWTDEEMSAVIARKSCEFLAARQAQPFFLMVATHNIHVPRVPNPRFKGTSDCGVRGDAIAEFDWTVGQVLDQLDKLGLAATTLVILSSDNGGINDDNGPDKIHGCGDPDATNGHRPNGVLRGTKGTIWEGGTRVPLVVRWPGKVQAGTSGALFSQVDLLASLASLTGQAIPAGHAQDSQNHLPTLLGTAKNGREFLLEQGNTGAPFGFRFGAWKLMPNAGPNAGPGKALFNLADDLAETRNVAAEHPEVVAKMTAKLQEITGQAPAARQPARRKKNPFSPAR